MLLHEICTQKIDQCLIEATLQQLQGGTDSAFPNRNEIASVRIVQKRYLRYGDSQLMIKAVCNGETDQYQTSILFEGVQFTGPQDPEAVRLDRLYIKPLTSQMSVKVMCTCPDFGWTFSWHNANNKSLIGNPPPPYKSSGQRPRRNPSKTPGLCKHLVRLHDDLQAEQFIQ